MVLMSDHKIVEPFLSILLYKNNLTGENISNNILNKIAWYGLDPVFWNSIIMDRVSTDTKSLKVIKSLSWYDPDFLWCLSHTFYLSGRNFKKSCPEMNMFSQYYNKSIMNRESVCGCVCVVPDTSPWSVSKLWGGGVPTLDSDCSGT